MTMRGPANGEGWTILWRQKRGQTHLHHLRRLYRGKVLRPWIHPLEMPSFYSRSSSSFDHALQLDDDDDCDDATSIMVFLFRLSFLIGIYPLLSSSLRKPVSIFSLFLSRIATALPCFPPTFFFVAFAISYIFYQFSFFCFFLFVMLTWPIQGLVASLTFAIYV